MHNMGWTLDDHFAREHFSWLTCRNDILQEWQIFDSPSVDICRIGLIPQDRYVAAGSVGGIDG
jgi:hypothetical protein